MVIDGVSPRRISNYLHRWAMWWVMTSKSWHYQEVMEWFLKVCWDTTVAAIARKLAQRANITPFEALDQLPPPAGSLDRVYF